MSEVEIGRGKRGNRAWAFDDIAIVPSTSYALSLAAQNLPAKSGQNLVLIAEDFPSNVYPWRTWA